MTTIALFSALISVAFASARPEWFVYYFDFLLWLETKGRFGKWLSKPMGECAKCVAGLLALVWSIATGLHWTVVVVNASAAILIAAVINKVYQWSQN